MKVKTSNIDEREYYYSSRSVEIQLAGKTIKTPERALINTELNAKSNIPLEIPLPSDISMISRRLHREELMDFLSENRKSENLIKYIEGYKLRMQHSDLFFALIQPTTPAIDAIRGNERLTNKFIRMITRVEEIAGLEFITLPWLGTSASKTVEVFSGISDLMEKEPIFFLDITEEHLRSEEDINGIVDCIIDLNSTERIHFLGLIYKPIQKALASYDLLWEKLRNLDIAIILADVKRYEVNYRNLSGLHLQEFVLGDVISTEQPGFGGGKKNNGNQKEERRKKRIADTLRFFREESLQVSSIREIGEVDWIDEISEEFKDSRVRDALEHYDEAQDDEEKRKTLSSISKVHEFIASSREFDKSREYISRGETKDYIEEKEPLKDVLRWVKGQSRF